MNALSFSSLISLYISFLCAFLISDKLPDAVTVRRSIYHALCYVGLLSVIFFSTVISLIN